MTDMANNPKQNLSIIFPAYNEELVIEKTIGSFYKEFKGKLNFEMIVVEDGSTDKTVNILKTLSRSIPIKVYSKKERKGYLKAIKRALKYPKYNWILLVDSDNQYYPEDFWKLWQHRNEYDIILGRKIERKDGIFREILSSCYNGLIRILFASAYKDIDTGFRLFKKDVANKYIRKIKYNQTFTAEFVLRAHFGKVRITEVPVRHRKRVNGGSNIFKLKVIPSLATKEFLGLLKLFFEIRFRNVLNI